MTVSWHEGDGQKQFAYQMSDTTLFMDEALSRAHDTFIFNDNTLPVSHTVTPTVDKICFLLH